MGSVRRYCTRQYRLNYYKKRTESRFPQMETRKKLTKQQKREILDFYKSLTGKKVSLIDHVYFYSRTGIYSKEYMPIGLYETEIIGRANRLDAYDSVLADKNLDDLLLPDVKHPHNILKNINGYYYYEGRPVSEVEAIALCQNIPEAIIKPSMNTMGQDVKKVSIVDGVCSIDNQSVEQLFSDYQKNFLIQEVLSQHESMRALNPTSVNTIRILTYRSGMEILVVYAVIRIGRKNQVVDNQSAGGISAKINSDGTLAKYGFGKVGDDMIEKTDTGIVLEGYQIPSYQKAVETAKRLHYSLPLFALVGWDICIDEEGEPILIEWNGRPGPSQTACGTGFGELTARIISEIWPNENSADKQ